MSQYGQGTLEAPRCKWHQPFSHPEQFSSPCATFSSMGPTVSNCPQPVAEPLITGICLLQVIYLVQNPAPYIYLAVAYVAIPTRMYEMNTLQQSKFNCSSAAACMPAPTLPQAPCNPLLGNLLHGRTHSLSYRSWNVTFAVNTNYHWMHTIPCIVFGRLCGEEPQVSPCRQPILWRKPLMRDCRLTAQRPAAWAKRRRCKWCCQTKMKRWEKVAWCRIMKSRTRNSHFTKKDDKKYKDGKETFLVGYTMSFYGDKLNNHDRRNFTFFNFTFCG